MNILFAFQISMCDKSRNTWLCVHWQWNTLEWCQLNALQASPVVHLVTPLSCVSLSMNTQPSVPAIRAHASRVYSFNFNDIHVSNICFNDACLHTLSTIISTWSKLSEIYFRICLLSRPEVVTEPALHCRFNDNFRWRHWHRSWHCDSSRFSTHYAMSLCMRFSGIFSPVNTEKTPRGFIIWSVPWLSHVVLFSMSQYFQPIRAIFDRDIMRVYGNYLEQNDMSFISHVMLPAKFYIVISARCIGDLCEIVS